MKPLDPALEALIAPLNPAQRDAVSAPPEHRLVLAGAGSGKTRVLTHRVAWLIAAENVSPYSILAVTFTNKAAAEMRGRIEQLISLPTRALWIGTFHGIANRLLRMHWKEARLTQNFQILDADDQQRLVKRVCKSLEMPEDQYPPKIVTGWINTQKEEGRRPSHFDDIGDFTQRQFVRAYTAYEAQCEKSGVVDFAELLLRAYELCRDNAEIQAHYRQRLRHFLVDEFQDTNTLQYNWLKVLAGNTGIMFGVGDDDQCLVSGTRVRMADGSEKPIEKIRVGDAVLSAYGKGEFRAARVAQTFKRVRKDGLIRLSLASGREITSTPEHTHFAGYQLGITPQTYFTYLMFKRGVGYRVGTSQVYTRGQKKAVVGFRQRCVQEHGDALWIIGTHASENAAREAEILLSLNYGLPMLPFTPRKGGSTRGLVHDAAAIKRVFAAMDTAAGALRLLKACGLDMNAPHHSPQSRDSNRRNIVVTLCGDRRGANPMHRISVVGNDDAGRAALRKLDLSVRAAKAGSRSWRFETCRKDFGELMQIATRIERALKGKILLQAHLTDRSLPFIAAAHIQPGMVMVTAEGEYDWVREVRREKPARREVYDLNVFPTHNFIANGLVTHNSVYSWRGAKVENMLHLSRDFPGCEIVRLEQNYRSTGTILKAANGLIGKNSGRLGKELWTDAGEGESIQLYAAFNEYDEAEFVVNRMKEKLDGRCRHSDLAILYRMSAQSRVLEETLIRARIPYRITGGLRFFERMEVKDALAYLRLLHNRDEDVSFERAVNTPARGIGLTTLDKLREIARASNVSLWSAAKNATSQLGRSAGKVLEFLNLIDSLARECEGMALSKMTEHVVMRSGLIEHYKKEKGEQAESRIENLAELANAARSFEKQPADTEVPLDPLNEFLSHAALEAGERQGGIGEDCVQLMTLHAAKGLEFPVVFLVGLEHGVFPNQRTLEEGNLEEERRLCYVGITRARQQLYLSYAEVRRVHGVEQIGMPSQFLREIPSDCVMETRPRSQVLRPAFAPPQRFGGGGWHKPAYERAGPPIHEDRGPGGFKLGQRVSHAKFGEGTILSFDGDGDRARVEVRFKDAGNKWLMLSLANLQAV